MRADMIDGRVSSGGRRLHVLPGAAVAAAFLVFFCSSVCQAHPPSNVSLSHDRKNGLLVVVINHNSKDTAGHYIKTVEIRNNGKSVKKAEYTSQPSPATFTCVYPVPAAAGDVLSVKAACSLTGSREEKITIPKIAK